MQIIGGTYDERCETPETASLAGSGMRAAAALAHTASPPALVSARSERENQVAEITASTLEVRDVTWFERSQEVRFSYFSPLTAPTITGAGSHLYGENISVQDDAVLVFGLVETAPITVSGRRVVMDPQRPRGLSLQDLPAITAEQVAWTLNERETAQLAGTRRGNVRDAAKALVEQNNLSVVVTKRGPRGALVTTPDHQVAIGAFKTPSVFPIGSGDVFAAAFAHAWAVENADPVEAAKVASAAAAHWCHTQDYAVPSDILTGNSPYPEVPPQDDAAVYLAGPFFNLQQRWLIDLARVTMFPAVFSPFHDVGPGGIEVAQKDIDGLHECDSVLALVDDNDPGTLFEVGYATALKMPTIAYAERTNDEGKKMMVGTGTELTDDISTAVYRAVWAAAEHRAARTSPR